MRGRRNVSGLALWKVAGRSACGDEKWIDSTPRDTPRLLRLRDSLNEFGDHFDRNHIHRDIPSLVITLLDWAQTPLFVDELVELIFNLTGGSSEVPVSLDTGGGECGDEQPSALEIPDAAPGPEVQAFQRQMIAATALYACGLMRGRLGSWLWGLDRENVDTLFSACAEPSAWTRCFGEALEPSMTVADLDALIGLGDMPKAVHRRYAKRLETSERCHHRYLRVVPLGDVEIAKFLGVRTPNVPYLRWCAKQEFVALYDRAFGGPSE